MKVLDLFSGIGGFSLGLERAGMETVAFCEISPVCRHLLAHHWPDVPCFDDVTTLTGERVGPVDVICGGFPCQDISFAANGARCTVQSRDRYQRIVATCTVNGRDLGSILVREGLAISETNYGDPYRREENQARERGRGVWQ